MNVLIVKDDPVSGHLLKQILENRSHQVSILTDAEKALEQCRQQAYDLVIVDWILPGPMDGLSFCRRLRVLPMGHSCVVLVASPYHEKERLQAILDAGADDYIREPEEIGRLKIRLEVAEQRVRHIHDSRISAIEQEQQKACWKGVYDLLRVGIVQVNEYGRIDFMNRMARCWFINDQGRHVLGALWEEIFAPADQIQIKTMALRAVTRRTRVPVHIKQDSEQSYWLDVEVQDDPRDARRRILMCYNMSEIYELRQQIRGKYLELSLN